MTAIVTGAGSGLGRALAVRLATDGWEIALCDIDTAAAAETCALVEAAGGRGRVERLDVALPAEWEALRERLAKRARVVEQLEAVLLTVQEPSGRSWDTSDAEQRVACVTIHGCHACVDWLKANPGRPHIVNVASLAAIGAAPGMAAYNVTKAGVVALSETLWTELRPHGVGVTVLCPSFFHTGLIAGGRFAEEWHRRVALGVADASGLSAEAVAEAAVRAVAARRLYVFLPARARLVWLFKRLFPLGFLALVVREVDRRFQSDARRRTAPGTEGNER
ncbi:MAG: SDR family NAD(P)-dependent oxidoreductase [Planctomycetia bacterium]|nr:SDR family NAD(P)-dependent oxidoreductase [Planctomycetia bacterium]